MKKLVVLALFGIGVNALGSSCWMVDRDRQRECVDGVPAIACRGLANNPSVRWTELRNTPCAAGDAGAPLAKYEFAKWACIFEWVGGRSECTDGVPPLVCDSAARNPGVARTTRLSGFCSVPP